MSSEKVKSYYQKQYDIYQKEFERLSNLNKQFSLYRILVFLATAAGVYFGSHHNMYTVISSFLPGLIVFSFLVRWHNKIIRKKEYAKAYMDVNEKELKILDFKYTEYDEGKDLEEESHPFSSDLDVFGQGSLFQYINRTVSFAGRKLLGRWFSTCELNQEEIKNRQEAIKELAPMPEWRQEFQVNGILASEQESDSKRIEEWLKLRPYFDRPIIRFLIAFNPIFLLASIIAISLGYISVNFIIINIFFSLSVVGNFYKRVNKIHVLLDQQSKLMDKYSILFEKIEGHNFKSKKIKDIQAKLKTKKSSAWKESKKLSSISRAFELRNNFIVAILLNLIVLWDLLQIIRSERWRKENAKYFSDWMEGVGDFDTLNSLATLYFNRPDLNFPTINSGEFKYKADGAGHLLIPTESRIDNIINFSNWKEFNIITGANMAGKSTYLRTVGSNFILSLMGAPVCAKELEISPVMLFTSIKTKDSLYAKESYFFAELKRLKAIINTLDSGTPLFIILDEILKGTNSKDKQMGSMALIEQLIRLGASGLIATHDLALGQLINNYPDNIKNLCFEVEFKDDRLIFDYKLKEGISKNLNATFLMKKMGITI